MKTAKKKVQGTQTECKPMKMTPYSDCGTGDRQGARSTERGRERNHDTSAG